MAADLNTMTPTCSTNSGKGAGNHVVTLANGQAYNVDFNCDGDANFLAEVDRRQKLAQQVADQAATAKLITDLQTKAASKKDLEAKASAQKEAPAPGINPGRRVQESAAAPGIDLSAQAPQSLQEPATLALKKRKLQTFSEQDSDIGNVNDMYGMKRGGVTMASRRGDGAAIRGKTKAGMR